MKIKYKKGTPVPSHEYYKDVFGSQYLVLPKRGFLVGCHSENISTHYKHPYAGDKVDKTILDNFGIMGAQPIVIPLSIRKAILRRLPHKVQRKIRYIFGEKLYAKFYSFIRS